jgi:hypothetical protein
MKESMRMSKRTTKKPELHLLKLGKGADADAENLARLFESLTGKRPSSEEVKQAASILQNSTSPPTEVPPKS